MNEPDDSEHGTTSQVIAPVHFQDDLNSGRNSGVSGGQDTGAVEEVILPPVHVQVHRWAIGRSPAPSESQDSDATEEGVSAPVHIGRQQRLELVRSPALSEGRDSDATEEGDIAPVTIGNQQRLRLPSPTYTEGHVSTSNEEGSAQVNSDGRLRTVPGSVSNNVSSNSSRPSVIFTRETSSNLQQAGSSETRFINLSPPLHQDVGVEDAIRNVVDEEIASQNNNLPVLLETQSNEPSQADSVVFVQEVNEGSTAGPSNQTVSHVAQDDEIIPVLNTYPDARLSTETPGPVQSPRQNVQGMPGGSDASSAVPVPQAGNPSDSAIPNQVGTPSSQERSDQGGRSRDSSVPPCKRQRLSSNSPEVPKQQAQAPIVDSDEDDGLTCTICLDHWTSSGEHRLVSLKCGHLFGFGCIERWIKNQKAAERKCPTCKAKVKMTDVRNLYGHRIQMVDTTELEELRSKKQELEREKEDLMREVGYMRKLNDDLQVKYREAMVEIQKLKTEKMASQRPKKNTDVPLHRYRAQLVQTLELSKNEGCRVLAYNDVRCVIAASLPSPTNLFKEYALKLIDAESFRARHTMPSHSRMIRDVTFSNDGKLLLSCSLDKTANVLCMDSNTSIATFHSEMPIWSVCWDADNPFVLFTGAQNGVVQQFDVRSPGQEVSRIITEGNPTPVASLAGIPSNSSVGWPQGGLISCRFRQLYPYERTSSNTFEAHPCSIDGAFTSLRYEKRTEHFLVSTRPTERSPRAQHMLFQMSSSGRVPKFNLVQNFFGSSTLGVISRSCIIPVISPQCEVEDMLVSSYVESESHVGLWSCSNGQKLQSIQSSETIMDLCPIFVNGKNYLSTLSDKRLRLYKIEKS